MIPQIIKPKLKAWEEHTFPMLDADGDPYISKYGINFPAVTMKAHPWTNGSVIHCYVYNKDLLDFFFTIIEKGYSYKSIEDYFQSIFKVSPDVYKNILINPDYAERYDEVKRNRTRRTRDIVEGFTDYETVDMDNKNSVYLAKAIHSSRIGVLSKIDKDYKPSSDSNINVSGNLAQIILPSKTEE